MNWRRHFRLPFAGITLAFLLIPQSGISANSSVVSDNEKKPVQISIEPSGQITPINPKESAQIHSTQEKWQVYRTFDELQQDIEMDVYVPRSLPAGYQLDKIEHLDETIKATYVNKDDVLLFTQSFISEAGSGKAVTPKCNVGSLQWTDSNMNFNVSGNNLSQDELELFKQTIFLLPFAAQSRSISFSPIEAAGTLQQFTPQNRTFRLYTSQQFLDFIKEENIRPIHPLQLDDNEMILGLFSGTKGSSGYTIAALQATSDESQIHIVFGETSPPPGSTTLAVITHPYQFISIQLPQGETVASVQVNTIKGEAVASLRMDK